MGGTLRGGGLGSGWARQFENGNFQAAVLSGTPKPAPPAPEGRAAPYGWHLVV